MQDRLRFRAWNKECESYAYNIQDFGSFYPNPYWQDSFADFLDDDDWIIEQCTGLKDKNGKLIYEGDIVECDEGIGKVFYSIPTASLGIEFSDYSIYGSNICHYDIDVIDCVIIGNIHENGDLLK